MELMRSMGKEFCRQGISRSSTDCGSGFGAEQDPVWTLSQVLLATGGRFVSGAPEARFRSISTDTRTLERGDLFLALAGDHFDGRQFVKEAISKGAAGLIVASLVDEELHVHVPVVLVEDPLRALGDLAAYRRALMNNLQVIAITGSSGKTTVKEMCATILKEEYNVLKTEGNFNNLIGMPLTLLRVNAHHDVAVLEMGMNRPGEIARMTEIADPDIACIINIQGAHLAGLHSIDGVARAKGELFQGGKSWARLCVNVDDKRVRALARNCSQEKITFGQERHAFVRATHIKNLGEEGVAFTLHIGNESVRLQLRSLGEHNVNNALAAAAMAYAAGVKTEQIAQGLMAFKPYDKRLQIETAGGLKIVNDCYNANPASMHAALDTLMGMKKNRKCVAILGDMLELGEESDAAHRRLGETAACKGVDYLFVYGQFARKVVEGALDARMTMKQVKQAESKEEITEAIVRLVTLGELTQGDLLLVKGSRGMRMETIIEQLRKRL
ncbi:MAG: UDP-N-acetylmuramoyl-tripeptide--D-alanyl-D-alanine ligase [Deltaproteobacteria bacterium]|nr:UDP-N-acetylmuramoyl-tripeptide--D-alanyl-D-alanine ligase [Deltaproteobacteria bacterium]